MRMASAGRVARRHRAESRIPAAIVILVVEEDDRERLLGVGVVKDQDLGGRDVVRPAAFTDLLP